VHGRSFASVLSMEASPSSHPPLTPRELEVLQLAADGDSVEEIAAALVLSPGTIRTHLASIYSKLSAKGRTAAVATALRAGWIS
jgi:two-component system response regulator DesR